MKKATYQFELRSTSIYKDLDKIIDKYPKLSKYNIKFTKQIKYSNSGYPYTEEKGFVTINDIQELLDFIEDCGNSVVIEQDKNKPLYTIEIYDDWRE